MKQAESDRIWQSAQTLKEFGEVTAQWLEGKLHHMPTNAYQSRVREELRTLVPILATLNRSGQFVTVNAQPANLDGNGPKGCLGDTQRAYVMVFATAEGRQALMQMARKHNLTFLEHKPGSASKEGSLLVGRDKGKDFAWSGYAFSPKELDHDYTGLHRGVIEALKGCWQVAVVDPEWGCNDVLWPALRELV